MSLKSITPLHARVRQSASLVELRFEFLFQFVEKLAIRVLVMLHEPRAREWQKNFQYRWLAGMHDRVNGIANGYIRSLPFFARYDPSKNPQNDYPAPYADPHSVSKSGGMGFRRVSHKPERQQH